MRKLILVALMATVPASAFALTPGEVIGSIFNFILDNIDKSNGGTINTNAKVILKSNANNIILGRLFFDKQGNVDQVSFPACGPNSANKRVDRVRLRVAEANAYVDTVRLTFQNGSTQTISVGDEFAKGTNSSWVNIGNNRCIRKIRASGEAQGGNKVTYTAVTFVGRLAN